MAKDPAAPPAEEPKPATAAPETPPAAAAGAAPAAATTAEPEAVKKKKSQPGVPPRRGKKLRNHLKNQAQRLAKEGVMPVRKAIQTLKSMKRVKFDETVEIHMKLGVDTKQA